MRTLRSFLTICAFLVVGTFGAFASNHGGAPLVTARGVTIPSLTHGQIIPMNQAYSRIVALATNVRLNPAYTNDPGMADVADLLRYARYERVTSLWGMVPGSLNDDTNQFHRPTHASLAAARELLVRLNRIAPRMAGELYSQVDEAMFLNGASIALCAFSTEVFNTSVPVEAKLSFQLNLAIMAIILLAILSFAGAALYRPRLPFPRRLRGYSA